MGEDVFMSGYSVSCDAVSLSKPPRKDLEPSDPLIKSLYPFSLLAFAKASGLVEEAVVVQIWIEASVPSAGPASGLSGGLFCVGSGSPQGPLPQKMVCQNDGDHGLCDRDHSRTNARIVPSSGFCVSRGYGHGLPCPIDGLLG